MLVKTISAAVTYFTYGILVHKASYLLTDKVSGLVKQTFEYQKVLIISMVLHNTKKL